MPDLCSVSGYRLVDKAVKVDGGHNEVAWGLSPSCRRQTGVLGRAPNAEAIFYSFFFKKIRIFKHTLVLILLKTHF